MTPNTCPLTSKCHHGPKQLTNHFVRSFYLKSDAFDSVHRKSEIFRVFTEYDKDRNGFISLSEAHQVLQDEVGFRPQQTTDLLRLCDKNSDGKLSFNEFVQFYFKVQEK